MIEIHILILIAWANIPDDWKGNYNKVSAAYDDCLKYDYGSIMHFGANLDGNLVITTTNPTEESTGQINGLSARDVGCIKGHYSS